MHLFRYLKKRLPDLNWQVLKTDLLKRFSSIGLGNPYEQLAAIRQTNWVEDYVRYFEILLVQLSEITKEQALGYFMNGLSDVIRRSVRTHVPYNVPKAISFARSIENELFQENEFCS